MLLAAAAIVLVLLLVHVLRPKPLVPYERRELLTDREWRFYEILSPVAKRHGWMILIKLRLADILQVKGGTDDYMAYFNKIKAKHTDFVLADPETLEVLCGVELDDPSHDRPERIERDEFVDEAYRAAGIDLLHVRMPLDKPLEEEELEELLLEILPDLSGQTKRAGFTRLRSESFYGSDSSEEEEEAEEDSGGSSSPINGA